MDFLKQLGMLLQMSLLALPQRLALACTTLIGVTCAVGVLVSMLAMGVGAQQQAMGNVRPDRATSLSVDAVGPSQSSMSKDVAVLVADLPGIRRNASGRPIAVPQTLVFVQARRTDSGSLVGFPITGVHLTSGRMIRPGLLELIASNNCAQYQHFRTGDRQLIQGVEWLVVGNFDLGRNNGSCSIYADVNAVQSAFRRSNYNDINVMLRSPAAFDELARALKGNPQVHAKLEHEAQLAQAGVQEVHGILNFVSYFVGAILGVGATIGAANSLYALVDSRRRELATLRAVGFSGVPIMAATLSEAILLAVPGALIGAGIAWLFFDGLAASPFGLSFHFTVTPSLAALGIGWALGIGVISGLLPALRAARIPVTVALRAK